MGDADRFDFVRDVFRAELEAVNARRAEVRRRTPPRKRDGQACRLPREVPFDADARPSTRHGLVGLALSGGGIRSAAFSLGVLQALNAGGVFAHVDYLSTVSGGGWIGSCLSALMRAPGSSFPFVAPFHVRLPGEADAADAAALAAPGTRNMVLEYLRDRASALVPSGFSGGLGMLSRVLRGALITVAMLTATLLAPALLLAHLVRVYLRVLAATTQAATHGQLPWESFMLVTPLVLGASVAFLLALPVLRTMLPRERRLADADRVGVALGAVSAAAAAFETHVFVTSRATPRIDVAHLDAASVFSHVAHTLRPALTPGVPTLAALGACAAALLAFRASLARLLPLLRVAALGLVAVASLAPLYLFVLYVSVVGSKSADATAAVFAPGWHSQLLAVSLLGLAFIVLMDTNEASLHSFFRAQIARLFIVRRSRAEGSAVDAIAPADSVPLTGLAQEGSIAPYHLLNAALNLQGSDDPSLRGRNSDFFTFSKHFVGGPRTGYCRTADLQRVLPEVDLAAAMTISAAAAAPNMGTYTLRPVVLLMAFLNLRLGYWLLNPDQVARGRAGPTGVWERFRAFPAGWCYFRELASALHARGRHVYLSDGGHLENTGAYELLRRRCRYVIICDAEEDPAMQFGGMAALIRFARLDLGVEIAISLDDLAPDDRGASRQHSALGRIRYPARDGAPEEDGTLVYIKSSRTGDEHPVIAQYRSTNPLFPHESTANQAFGEAQFEAYRALGEHVTRGLSGDRFVGHLVHAGTEPLADWFAEIETRVAPTARYEEIFPDLRDELEEVDALLRAPEAAGYFAELYPELAAGGARPEVAPAVLHEAAMRQIHLIASAYTQLRLDDVEGYDHPWHRGWIQLFRRWMASPMFRRVWLVGSQSYGPWLRRFCEARFGRPIYPTWTETTGDALAADGLSVSDYGDAPHPGAIHLRCDLHCDWNATLEGVAAVRLAFSLADGRATVWKAGACARPGFDDLAASQQVTDSLEEALRRQGLTLSPGPDAPPSPVGAEARALLEEALAAARAAAPAAAAGAA
jgi:hypothetical protein